MLAVAAAALRVLAAAAQQDFRSGVNLVLVDMRVLQGDDQVTDLRVEEVTLLVDGIPRPIVSFSYRVLEPGKHGDRARVERSKAASPLGVVGPRPSDRAGSCSLSIARPSNPVQGRGSRRPRRSSSVVLPAGYALAVATLPLEGGIRFDPDRRASARALTEALKRASGLGSGLEGVAGFGCTGASASEGCRDRPGGAPEKAREMNLRAEWELRGRAVLRDLQWLFRAVGDGPSDVVLISGGYPRLESMRAEIERTIKAARITGVRVHALDLAAPVAALEMPRSGGRAFRGGWTCSSCDKQPRRGSVAYCIRSAERNRWHRRGMGRLWKTVLQSTRTSTPRLVPARVRAAGRRTGRQSASNRDSRFATAAPNNPCAQGIRAGAGVWCCPEASFAVVHRERMILTNRRKRPGRSEFTRRDRCEPWRWSYLIERRQPRDPPTPMDSLPPACAP